MMRPLRFHWRLIQGGDVTEVITQDRVASKAALPEIAAQTAFCREAEQLGIDSVLVDIGVGKPDPMVLAMVLTTATDRLKFMVAHRPGLMSPTLFVQQVNTFSILSSGRITLNFVAGHSPAEQLYYGDNLPHDARYERMREYLTICRRFWSGETTVNFAGRHYRIEAGRVRTPFIAPGRQTPEVYLGGGSRNAREVASELADCWLRFGDTVENVAKESAPVLANGGEVGLRIACIARPTRSQALNVARALLESSELRSRREREAAFVRGSDSESMRHVYELGQSEWLDRCLWAGAVRALGATSISLVGTPDDVADEILKFKQAGVSQFILHGWPKWEEMRIFCREVLPLLKSSH
ncbi:MAG: LLM class flavin-dependent oxidoreductase [Verrucomicrobia bacterium]|jgi:alkanesulfonate monooxygenase|nr:LLM class flavin-dependent oxidoreductase [Verrucomicrobiota bacterium]